MVSIYKALELIKDERERQIKELQYTIEGDRKSYKDNQLLIAAQCYLNVGDERIIWGDKYDPNKPPKGWPWGRKWWKPSNRLRELVKAGALLLAHYDLTYGIEALFKLPGILNEIVYLLNKDDEEFRIIFHKGGVNPIEE